MCMDLHIAFDSRDSLIVATDQKWAVCCRFATKTACWILSVIYP